MFLGRDAVLLADYSFQDRGQKNPAPRHKPSPLFYANARGEILSASTCSIVLF